MTSQMENATPSNVPYTFEHSKNLGNKILKPIRQEKVVKVPVTKYVEKLIEREEVKYVNKYVDVIKPIITYKTKHIPKHIYLDKIKYEPKLIEKEKIIHIPKIEYRNKIVEIPVYIHKENIIEKKVPIIIEHVIPVLKVNKIEKEVLTDMIQFPEICNMPKNENTMRNEVSSNKSVEENKTSVVGITKEDTDIYNKETYRNVDSIEEPVAINEQMEMSNYEKENIKREDGSNRSISKAPSSEGSYKVTIEHKNETMYNDETNEDAHYNEIPENTSNMMNNVNNLNENYYDVNENRRNQNISHLSIHLPISQEVSHESGEQAYTNISHNNNSNNYVPSLNHLIKNNQYINYNNMDNRYSERNMNDLINNQYVQESFTGSRRNIPAYANENMSQQYHENLKNCIEIDQQKVHIPSNMNISCENYSVSQKVCNNTSQSGVDKKNFTPYYANSNGQAFVSIRPATILEYSPKPRKFKSRFCNIMNKCCGGE
ncbi:inner membrane complex protein 1i, putative [Plasmodium chabaudi adami]|uniref:Inner membrane complex protein 1i, putative n=1 Tax=Plasmodium chabaudi adami TaxID=5826 RepID=A0A1C6XKL4_PLACE|nr:inner membrane complex protein 1i, putative [Plasmodium chabaudi adami]